MRNLLERFRYWLFRLNHDPYRETLKNPLMKKHLILIVLALGLAFTFSGCTTTPTGQKVPDPILLSAVAQNAASVGTTLWLQSHPNDRPAFELARTSLKALVAAGSGSPADLQVALSGLPLKQLQGQTGAVVVASAVSLIDAAGNELNRLDATQKFNALVLPVAQGLVAGLNQALGTQ